MDVPTLIAAKILGMGMPELIIILVVVLVIFGPKNLPKLGATLGKTVKSVREGMEGKELDEGEVVSDDDDDDEDSEEEPKAKKSSKTS
jgi:sec-independent protein translocase protein TatA